jgi:transcriptional regulator with XRE-family HTH domain
VVNALIERVHEALRQAEAHTRRARLILEGDKPPVVERADETVGERLKRLRDERGLSQRQISSPGVSYAYISRIEAGARTPSVKAIRLLAEKLGVTPEYLETGDDLLTVKLPREVVLLAIWAQRTGDDIRRTWRLSRRRASGS